MNLKFFFFSALFTMIMATVFAAPDPLLIASQDNAHINVNNRILAKVNGKPISVFDVMKKMDVLFYREFPEYASSTQARCQFYLVSWKRVLQDLIDKELILADAEESKMQVSTGDVRQEMEQMFGPNVHANLDKVGISFEEGYKMVYSDIVLKRMLYIRANSKALKEVTPQVVRKAYEEHAKNNIKPASWTYAIISIRDKDPTKAAEAAHQTHKLLTQDQLPLEKIKEKTSTLASVSASTSIAVSDEMTCPENELSPLYKETLSHLPLQSFSQPLRQKSRQENTTIFRIFYLKSIAPSKAATFDEVGNELKEKLLDEAASKATQFYLKRLRKHFDVQENISLDSENFHPFSLN
jgi:SurA N-terminal domain